MTNKEKIITIVGGSGFLGLYLVKLLAQKGYKIRVIARDIESALSLKTMGEVGQINLVSADISKPESLQNKLNNSFAVINLVGILFEAGKQKFKTVQENGAGNLAKMAKVAGAKHFVQISAIGADKIPESKYAVSKLAGERAVLKEFPDAVIVRPSIIFGAEDNFFNQFAKMATKSPCLPLIGGGKTKFQPVYVGDVAKAIIAIIESDKFGGNIFEIGGPDIYSFREILELICKITGRKPFFNYLPFWLAGLIGNIFELLPTKPPITSDQVKLLKHDNIVDNKFKTLSDLGIIPESVKNIVPSYLLRYRNQ